MPPSHPSSDSPSPAWLQMGDALGDQDAASPSTCSKVFTQIVLLWPGKWRATTPPPCASRQTDGKTSNLSFPLANSGAETRRKGPEVELRWPQAERASSLGRSENRVHWKSAKLQYIGISICQLLNSKTDCLKTESVSYSKFTLNSSPFLHL